MRRLTVANLTLQIAFIICLCHHWLTHGLGRTVCGFWTVQFGSSSHTSSHQHPAEAAVQAWTIVARSSSCPLIMHNSLSPTVPWGVLVMTLECNKLLVCIVQPDAVSLSVRGAR
jgi:hypothetical protein